MSGLTTTVEITRMGRSLISKLMKGVATGGISHIAIGSGPTSGSYSSFGTNKRVGNNMEMVGFGPVVVHNDFPIYNFGPNGDVGNYYFIEEQNNQRDLALSFGPDTIGANLLKQDNFNHLFMVHKATGSFGFSLANLVNIVSHSPVQPTAPVDTIAYVGYAECDTTVKTTFNPARMFNKIFQGPVQQVDFLGDRAISGTPFLETLQPTLIDVTTEPNPSLLLRTPLAPGLNDTIREIAVLGDSGNDIIAWAPVTPGVVITAGNTIFIRWALAF